ncbi:MAG: hypothetical protein U1F56_08655 [Rubrivivax sp.]
MSNTLTRQAAALSLSALVTLGLMAGIQGLAEPHAAASDTLASAPVEVQTVVVTGQRLPRS